MCPGRPPPAALLCVGRELLEWRRPIDEIASASTARVAEKRAEALASFAEISVERETTRLQRLVRLVCRGVGGTADEPSTASDDPAMRIRLTDDGKCVSFLQLHSDTLVDAVTEEPVWQEHCLVLPPGCQVVIETDVDFVRPDGNGGRLTAKLTCGGRTSTTCIYVSDETA